MLCLLYYPGILTHIPRNVKCFFAAFFVDFSLKQSIMNLNFYNRKGAFALIRLCAFADEAGSSLQTQINALHRNGIGLLEIRTVDSVNIGDMTLERAEEVAAILKENGIQVWSLGSPMGKVSLNEGFDFEEYLSKVEHMCKLTKIFGADKIRMFSFFDAYEKKEQVFEYLQKMVEVADRYGVKLCHENEKSIYGDTLERVQELMANVPGLKFIYDPANYIQCGESSAVTLPTLHSKMEYFHIRCFARNCC